MKAKINLKNFKKLSEEKIANEKMNWMIPRLEYLVDKFPNNYKLNKQIADLYYIREGKSGNSNHFYNQLVRKHPKKKFIEAVYRRANVDSYVRVAKFDDQKLLYKALPKCGSTTIKLTILNEIHPEKVNKKQVHNVFDTYISVNSLDNLKDYKDHFKFCVIRNPIDRVVSYYTGNILQRKSLFNKFGSGKYWGLRTQPSLKYFVNNLQAYRNTFYDVDHHLTPITGFIGENGVNLFDKIYDLKELDQAVTLVKERFGIEDGAKKLQRMNTIKSVKGKAQLSDDQRTVLKRFYEQDFDNYASIGNW